MSSPHEESVPVEHRLARRACTTWALVVPTCAIPLAMLGPVLGIPLFLIAVIATIRTRRGVDRPFAYGAYHWRLVADSFRRAIRPPLIVGALTATATAILWALPTSAAAALAAVGSGVILFFSIALALGGTQEVAFDQILAVLVERRVAKRTRYESGLILMRRAEDVDRRAIALFGEPLIRAAIEAMPPFEAAFDGPPGSEGRIDRFGPLADSFEVDQDSELAEALREVASVVEAAAAEGLRCRLVAIPPYPCAQALELSGSLRWYA